MRLIYYRSNVMKRAEKRTLRAALVALFSTAAVLAAQSLGAAVLLFGISLSAQAEVIHACAQKNRGTLRLVNAPEECQPNSETAVAWADATGLEAEIDELDGRVADLEAENAALVGRVADLEVENADLNGLVAALETENAALLADLACVSPDSDGDNLYFEGCNVHVRNGSGMTDTSNGYGNLIVGYNETDPDGGLVLCSNGAFNTQPLCEANAAIWEGNQKTGSHYVVIGRGHSYTQFGGLVAGRGHFVNGREASVSGGGIRTPPAAN
jgi:hypothetical protein